MNITEFPKLQVKQDSTITFYIDIEYTFFTLFFQEDFSLNDTSGGPLRKQGHSDLLMLFLPF